LKDSGECSKLKTQFGAGMRRTKTATKKAEDGSKQQ